MPISKKITDAIALKVKANPTAPANVFSLSESDITDLGYKEIKLEKSILQVGDIMPLSKDHSLWLVLESVDGFRKTLKEPVDKISGPVYRK